MGAAGPKPELATLSVSEGGSLRTVTSAAEPDVGARLGQFRVDARIGQGGLGIVYRAYDEKRARPGPARRYVLKRLMSKYGIADEEEG
jgi:hypothetical protein